MPTIPHRRTFLAGLGVAGSVLGGVVATFAVASALVTFTVWPADPVSSTSPAATLDARQQATRQRPERPLVLPAPSSADGGTSARAPAGQATRSSAGASPRRAAASTGRARGAAASAIDGSAPEIDGAPDLRPAPAPPRPPPENGIERLGGAVEDATDALGRTLRSGTDRLGRQLDPLSPALGGAVTGLGTGLGATVEGVGRVLAALLGHRPR